MIKRQPRCVYIRENGERCSNARLSKDGLQRLAASGVDLVADAAQFCSYRARTPASRREMQSQGGAFSKQRHDERKAEKLQAALDARDPMPREIVAAVQPALKQLLAAKLPGTREPDAHSVAFGGFVAVHMYVQPDIRERLFKELLPASLQMRDDLWSSAEERLRAMVDELPADEREAVWELLTSTAV
jgi:hypothetical protein